MVSDELHNYTKTGIVRSSDDIVTRLRERAIVLFSNGADGNAFIDEHAADEIERLRAENQMLNEALANKGTKQVAKIVSTTSSCDEWMLPIFAKHNRHLCDGCGREKYHHSYEWVPAVTPLGGSYKPWSLEQIDKWREDDLISKERYHFLISVTEDFDKPKAVRGE